MKIKEIKDGKIIFDNGTTIEDFHSQDCCEHVYADFNALKTEAGIMEHEFNEEIKIEGVENSGFRIEGFFCPCYDSQNGCYSSQLDLIIKYPNKTEKTIDITEFTKEDY